MIMSTSVELFQVDLAYPIPPQFLGSLVGRDWSGIAPAMVPNYAAVQVALPQVWAHRVR